MIVLQKPCDYATPLLKNLCWQPVLPTAQSANSLPSHSRPSMICSWLLSSTASLPTTTHIPTAIPNFPWLPGSWKRARFFLSLSPFQVIQKSVCSSRCLLLFSASHPSRPSFRGTFSETPVLTPPAFVFPKLFGCSFIRGTCTGEAC